MKMSSLPYRKGEYPETPEAAALNRLTDNLDRFSYDKAVRLHDPIEARRQLNVLATALREALYAAIDQLNEERRRGIVSLSMYDAIVRADEVLDAIP